MTAQAHSAPQLPAKPVSPHGRVTAVSMMKDEGPFLLEWVAHHLAVGFTDLVVYTNDCTDGTDTMLMRLEELGLAHHRNNLIASGKKPQPSALNHAQDDRIVQNSDWVLVFDADEFLCIKLGDGTIDTLLDAIVAEGGNGMVLTWRIFGSAGIEHWDRQPVTERFTMAAPYDWNKGWGVKTMFRFDDDHWKLGIHRPRIKKEIRETDFPDTVKWLNGSGHEMAEYFKFRGWRSVASTVGFDWAQLNHYAVKSIDSYALRRFRGNVNNKSDKYNSGYWALQDRNEIRDDAALRYTEDRARIMQQLLSDPELARLHERACAMAEERLAEIRANPDYPAFVEELKQAGSTPLDQVDATPHKPRDPDAIARNAAAAASLKDAGALAAAGIVVETPEGPGANSATAVQIYLREIPDIPDEDPDMSWHKNHSVQVPAEPRVFTAPAIFLIKDGRFQRNLARKFPKLVPSGGMLAEIGSASAFLASHLYNEIPDIRFTLAERDPNLLRFIERIWQHNGIARDDRLSLTAGPDPIDPQAVAAWIDGAAPDLLMLGEPLLGISALGEALGQMKARPEHIALHGRLWFDLSSTPDALQAMFEQAGYGDRKRFDPKNVAVWKRTAS